MKEGRGVVVGRKLFNGNFIQAHNLPLGYDIKDKTAAYTDYTNKKTGKSDPIIRFSDTLMAHLSTLKFRGYVVQDVKTKEIIRLEGSK